MAPGTCPRSGRERRRGRHGLAFSAAIQLLASGSPAAAQAERFTPQDPRIVAQVLHFSGIPATGPVRIAVVYNAGSAASRAEATETVALLSGITSLQPVLVEQAALPEAAGIGALLTAADVSPELVRRAMQERHLPCLTLHESQVRDGACLVGIRSEPSVVITLNQVAAEAAGVRFATAFRMMVREL